MEGSIGSDGRAAYTPLYHAAGLASLAMLLPWSMLIQRWLYGVKAPSLHSVVSRFRFDIFGRALLFVLPLWVLVTAVLYWSPLPAAEYAYMDIIWFLVATLLLTPLQGAGEEYGFRGLIFRIARGWTRRASAGLIVGILVSSVLFAIVHFSTDLVLNVYYLVFAVGLALITWRTGGIEIAVVLHAGFNTELHLRRCAARRRPRRVRSLVWRRDDNNTVARSGGRHHRPGRVDPNKANRASAHADKGRVRQCVHRTEGSRNQKLSAISISQREDDEMGAPAPPRPNWLEIVIGLVGIAVFGVGSALLIIRLPLDPVVIGLMMAAISGLGGLSGFFLAFGLRIRDWGAFGIRRPTRKWLMAGIGAGVITFIVKSLSILAYAALVGDNSNVQEVYAQGGSGGLWSLILATLMLSVLTPLGEEFLFRGVVTSALLKYGPWIGVVGGALIFALFHGINPVFPAALVTGLVAGEIFRRSGSIWPAVVVHSVVNLPTVPLMVLAGVSP